MEALERQVMMPIAERAAVSAGTSFEVSRTGVRSTFRVMGTDLLLGTGETKGVLVAHEGLTFACDGSGRTSVRV